MGRGLKCFVMGQFLFIKYRINQEFKSSCAIMNAWIEEKTSAIGFLNSGYKKVAKWIFDYANRELNPQAGQPQQPQ